MTTLMKKFLSDDSGATALEYGLIASLIAVAIIAGLRALSSNLNNTFNKVSTELSTANSVSTTR
jgi:pilus assembly protein Flp/PilA